jgi:hypothetical protein
MLRAVQAGPLTAMLDGVDLRYVKLGELELVRRIYVAVRDRNWNTIPGVPSELELDERDDSFEARFTVRHTSHDTDYEWRGTIVGTADGRISFTMDGRGLRDMHYNRVGFCVLQPWRECAGRPYRGTTPEGIVTGTLPLLVGPQRFENGVYVPLFPSVSRLEVDYEEGPTAVIEFEGDLFETEDQRNWTDASFKTYCTPLARGFPHELKKGDTLAQTVTVLATGRTDVPSGQPESRLAIGGPTGERVPPVGLAQASRDPSAAELELLRALAPAHVRVDVHLAASDWGDELARALRLCAETGAALEVALFVRESNDLLPLREALGDAVVARVLVVPEGAQTVTDEETTPPELVAYARDGLALEVCRSRWHQNVLHQAEPDAAHVDAFRRRLLVQNPQCAFDDISTPGLVRAAGARRNGVAGGRLLSSANADAGGKLRPLSRRRRMTLPIHGSSCLSRRRGRPRARSISSSRAPPQSRISRQWGRAASSTEAIRSPCIASSRMSAVCGAPTCSRARQRARWKSRA